MLSHHDDGIAVSKAAEDAAQLLRVRGHLLGFDATLDHWLV